MASLTHRLERSAPVATPLPMASLRHPSEYSRLLLALAAIAVVFGTGGLVVVKGAGPLGLGVLTGVLLVLMLSIWLGLQIYRAQLLGRSVRVTADTLPEIQEVLDEVRTHVDYHRRVDVYVIQKHNPPALLTSWLGTKIILLEGALIGDLVADGERDQLAFLLGRHVGALKARHERFAPIVLIITVVESIKLLNLFLLPYYRATAYSGDQIGQACSGRLSAAVAATGRLLVGRELEPTLQARGMVEQGRLVRGRVIPRVAQLFAAEPHLTNRYLNVLFFGRRTQPEAWAAFHRALDPTSQQRLEHLWRRSPHPRHPHSAGRRIAVGIAYAGVSGALLAGAA